MKNCGKKTLRKPFYGCLTNKHIEFCNKPYTRFDFKKITRKINKLLTLNCNHEKNICLNNFYYHTIH